MPMHQICMKNADITIYLRKGSNHSINPLRCDFGGNRSSICMGGSTEVKNLETDPLTVARSPKLALVQNANYSSDL